MKSGEIKFSIIIPTYNRPDPLKKTLESVAQIDYPDFEVVIADDGSSVDLKPVLRLFEKKLNLIYARHPNQGRAATRNLGARHASGDYFVLIDDHFCAHPGLLKEYTKVIESRFRTKKQAHVMRGAVFFAQEVRKIKDSDRFLCRPPTFGDRQNPFKMFITNNVCISRHAFFTVGGFDEEFNEYGYEDSEMGCRLKDAGFRFTYVPRALGAIFSVPALPRHNDKFVQTGRMLALFGVKNPRHALSAGYHWANFLLARIYETLHLEAKAFEKYKQNPSAKNDEYYRMTLFLKGLLHGQKKYSKSKHFKRVMGQKNILLYSHQANRAGAPLSLVTLANALSKDFSVTVACKDLGIFTNLSAAVNFVKVPKLFSKTFLSNLMIKRNIALVHINSLLAKELAPVTKKLGRKVVFHLREDLAFFEKDLPFVKKWADRTIIISKSMAPALEPFKIKADVVYNSFESPIFKKLASKKSNTLEVFIVGTIENRKGQHLVIEALPTLVKKYPEFKLNIVGSVLHSEKSYLRKLKKEIKQNRLEKQVKFWGAQSEMTAIYAQADLVLIPSLAEPFGRVAIEAGYYGKPVICSNRGGLPEIIVNGKTGLVFNPDKKNDLSAKVLQFLDLSSKEKLAMGLNARERVLSVFNVETMVTKIKKIYEEELDL